MKYLMLGILAGMIAVAAFAQEPTCDLTMNMSMAHNGVTDIDSKTVFTGLTKAEYEAIVKDGNHTLDVASRAQDKGGPYMFAFSGASTCPGNWAAVEARGVQAKDAARIWRAAAQFTSNVVARGEVRAQKGHKHVIGKD